MYHINKKLLESTSIELFFIIFFSKFGLDLSFILIPIILGLSNIKRNFKEKIQNLLSLKEKILHIRKEVAGAIIEDQDINDRRAFILDPIILNEIKKQLRNYNFTSNVNYADILDELLRYKALYQIDLLLIEIIKLIRKYDNGRDYESLKKNFETEYILKELNNLNPPNLLLANEKEELKKNFINNILWVITYELFYEKEGKYPALIFYHED